MKRDDYVAVVRLATTLIHKDLSELFTTAETNPSLVIEWLAELSVAQRLCTSESDLGDLRAALRHTRPPRDNVVPVTSTAARDGRLGGNPRSLS